MSISVSFFRQSKPSLFTTTLLLLLSFSLFSAASANNPVTESEHKHHRHGLHGILLFSDGVDLYASHLPMFHYPHDKQVIFRFTLQDQSTQHALITVLSKQQNYWTLAPERFDLNRLGAKDGIISFKADLYSGHFERGGKLVHKNQVIQVEHMLINETLSRDKLPKTEFVRLTPTQAKQQFYARLIQGKPGADQIFRVNSQQLSLPKQLRFASNKLSFTSNQIAQKLGIEKDNVGIYYQEFGDLR